MGGTIPLQKIREKSNSLEFLIRPNRSCSTNSAIRKLKTKRKRVLPTLCTINILKRHKPDGIVLRILTHGQVQVYVGMLKLWHVLLLAHGKVLAGGLADDLPVGGGAPPVIGRNHNLVEAGSAKEGIASRPDEGDS